MYICEDGKGSLTFHDPLQPICNTVGNDCGNREKDSAISRVVISKKEAVGDETSGERDCKRNDQLVIRLYDDIQEFRVSIIDCSEE